MANPTAADIERGIAERLDRLIHRPEETEDEKAARELREEHTRLVAQAGVMVERARMNRNERCRDAVEAGVTKSDLARIFDVDRTTIYRWIESANKTKK